MQNERIYGLDIFRAWAILLMIIFHLFFDLNYFHYIHINMHKDIFWHNFRLLIVSMFLLSVGMSLALTHYPKILWKKMVKRTLVLGIASLLVTLSTYIIFPHAWVYFGILHFILIVSWLGLFFCNIPQMALVLAVVILVGYNIGWIDTHWLFEILQKPLHLPPRFTVDLVQIIPWFALVLLGIVIVRYNLHLKIFTKSFFSLAHTWNKPLTFMGKHALIIYLIHQPILFGLFMLFT